MESDVTSDAVSFPSDVPAVFDAACFAAALPRFLADPWAEALFFRSVLALGEDTP